MDELPVTRVWATIRSHARDDDVPPSIRHVCAACAEAVPACGVGVSINRGGDLREPVCAVGDRAEELEDLQFTLGEGPLVDSFTRRGAVLVADLASGTSTSRWPVFAPSAVQQGARAVFAFPLQTGAVYAGVLTVYRDTVGALSDGELATALAYADAAMLLVLANGKPPFHDVHAGISDGYDERRSEVHQAAGMISVQLRVGVDEALVRLRAHAYAQSRRLAYVARDVVARRLRFTDKQTGNPAADDDNPRTGA